MPKRLFLRQVCLPIPPYGPYKTWRAWVESNDRITVLQTAPLPLGYRLLVRAEGLEPPRFPNGF